MAGKAKARYLAGARAGIPVLFGFVPVGIAYAIMARQAGFTGLQTCLMSLTVFAGASQMMAVGMYAQGAGLTAMILATFILNLRHLIMSVCVMEPLREAPVPLKLLAAFGVTDESFAIFTTREWERDIFYFLGLITVTYGSWNLGTLLGVVASDFLPTMLAASLGVGLYAMFIALLVPNLRFNGRLGLLVAATGLLNCLLNQWMPSSWALIVSALAGAFAGVFFVELDGGKEGEHGRE